MEACAGAAASDGIIGNNNGASGGSTFAGTTAGCAAGLKTLEIYQRDNILQQARTLAELAQQRMSGWAEKFSIVSEVRSLGLLMGVSFTNPDNDALDDTFMARSVRNEMLLNGVWAICENEPTLRMYPALNMDEQVFLEALDIMEMAIEFVEKNGNSVGYYPALPSGNLGF